MIKRLGGVPNQLILLCSEQHWLFIYSVAGFARLCA